MSGQIDFTATLAQQKLAKRSDSSLSTELADISIAIAYRIGTTPHAVHRASIVAMGFTEDEWRAKVEPALRAALAAPVAAEPTEEQA